MNASPSKLSGRYQIEHIIADGGVAVVYCARDTQLGRMVAIKRMWPETGDAADREQAFSEAARLAALHHPNIVAVYDFGSDEQGAYVVMELVKGETIEAAIARGPMTWQDFSLVAEQSLGGLVAAHRAGMIHRDLKPGNLMLTWLPGGEFQVKILDFGLAKVTSAPSAQTVAQDGSVLGSIYIMPPEQLRKEALDGRSDLYSLGCVFYYALTGYMPFTGETVADVVASHLQHQVTSLEVLRPDLSPDVCAWVIRLIEAEPASRFKSAADALDALRKILRGEPVAAFEPPAYTWRRRILWSAVALLAILSLCLSAWAVFKSQTKTVQAPSSQAAASEGGPILNATDLVGLSGHVGQKVTVEGVVVAMEKDRKKNFRRLSFGADPDTSLSLIFQLDEGGHFSSRTLSPYLNRRVRATGVLGMGAKVPQIEVKSLSDLQLVEN